MKFRRLLTAGFALLLQAVVVQRAGAEAGPTQSAALQSPVSGSSGASVALAAPSNATPSGLWLTQDHDGIISITPCAGGLCARIVGVVLDRPTDAMPVDYRGMSQCGLTLITDARQTQPGLWKGHILDPRNGSLFGVDLKLDPYGRLALRGYLGIPLLGRTEIWTRYNGPVPADCRLVHDMRGEARNQDGAGSSG